MLPQSPREKSLHGRAIVDQQVLAVTNGHMAVVVDDVGLFQHANAIDELLARIVVLRHVQLLRNPRDASTIPTRGMPNPG